MQVAEIQAFRLRSVSDCADNKRRGRTSKKYFTTNFCKRHCNQLKNSFKKFSVQIDFSACLRNSGLLFGISNDARLKDDA